MYLEELDRDTSLPPKEHEPKDVAEVEDTSNSDVLEESQVNMCIDKSIDASTSVESDTCTKNDKGACASKETSTSEEKNVTPPKTAAEVFEKHRLVFHDVNAVSYCYDNELLLFYRYSNVKLLFYFASNATWNCLQLLMTFDPASPINDQTSVYYVIASGRHIVTIAGLSKVKKTFGQGIKARMVCISWLLHVSHQSVWCILS